MINPKVIRSGFEYSLDLQRSRLSDTEQHFALVPESGETSLGPFGLGLESVSDLTDLGLHGSVDNDDSSSALGNLGSGKDHADSVTKSESASKSSI